jgi:hypothetical protein
LLFAGAFGLSGFAFGVLLSCGDAVELPAAPPLASVLGVGAGGVVSTGPDSGVLLAGGVLVGAGAVVSGGFAEGVAVPCGAGFVELPPIGVVSLIGGFWPVVCASVLLL